MNDNMTQRTIAVTGASGFIGHPLVHALKQSGFTVRPVSGLRADAPGLSDLADRSFQGVDTVIHCSGSPMGPRGTDLNSERGFERDALKLTNHVIHACRNQGVKRLMFLSSAKVYEDPEYVDVYAETKLKVEQELSAAATDNFETLSLRIPMVYHSKPKANFALLRTLAGLPVPLPFASIHNQKSLLAMCNLSRAVIALVTAPAWPNVYLDLADPGPCSTPELLRSLAQAQNNSSFRLFRCPLSILTLAGKLTGKSHQARSLMSSLVVNPDPLHQLLPELSLLTTKEAINVYFSE